jgi:hypothetical protein
MDDDNAKLEPDKAAVLVSWFHFWKGRLVASPYDVRQTTIPGTNHLFLAWELTVKRS